MAGSEPSNPAAGGGAPCVDVVAGVLWRDGRVLLARRCDGGCCWEFPGGKVQPYEDPAAALARELREELGIHAEVGASLGTTAHADAARTIRLQFLAVTAFSGEPRLSAHSESAWVLPGELIRYDLMPADVDFARQLALSHRGSCNPPSGVITKEASEYRTRESE